MYGKGRIKIIKSPRKYKNKGTASLKLFFVEISIHPSGVLFGWKKNIQPERRVSFFFPELPSSIYSSIKYFQRWISTWPKTKNLAQTAGNQNTPNLVFTHNNNLPRLRRTKKQ